METLRVALRRRSALSAEALDRALELFLTCRRVSRTQKKDGGLAPAVVVSSSNLRLFLEVRRHVQVQVAARRVVHTRERVALGEGRVAARVDGIEKRRILVGHVVDADAYGVLLPRVRRAQVDVADCRDASIG